MENKKLTPQESMELITSMIQQSKQRVAMPDVRVSIMWAALSIISAIAVWVLLITMRDPRVNYIWFAIPVIGIPLNILMIKKSRTQKTVRTYIDVISDGLWKLVGFSGIGIALICVAFSFLGYHQQWLAMYFYAFVIVGFGAAMMGVILKEWSYIFGGVFSILSGFAIICMVLCGLPLLVTWAVPLYILCFLLMFILPAFVIRKKINRAEK